MQGFLHSSSLLLSATMVSSSWIVAYAIPAIHASQVVRSGFPRLSLHSLNKRAPLTTGWTSQGCITDDPGARSLRGASFADPAMTANLCIAFCSASTRDFVYAATEFGTECFCGNSIDNGATNATLSECDMNCGGDVTEKCGAGGRMNLYWSGKQPPPPPPPPITVPSVGLWESLGCYTDVPGRTLTTGMGVEGPMTIPGCTSACFEAGYGLAGTEYGVECFCGSTFSNGGLPATNGCTMTCAGNASTFCGGPDRLNVYNFTGTLPPRPVDPPAPGQGPPVFPVLEGLQAGWSYAACYVDNAFGRVFPDRKDDSQVLTAASCIAICSAENYTLAVMQYSQECYCGNALTNGAAATTDSQCQMACTGNSTQACGGPARLSVYTGTGNVTAYPVPVVQTTDLPGNWTYKGCMQEGANGAPRVFPYFNELLKTNTVPTCLKMCSDFGYPSAGMQNGGECWCGDHSDIEKNGGIMAPETECQAACTGDPIHLCGGGQRLQLYQWAGALDTWHTPTNIGRYEQLIGSILIPLIATLGINNKITFLEKGGTSKYENSTGGAELDLTFVGNVTKAWREMHPKTDVFCAASLILPDKAGRQINIGGWSLQDTFGVRLFTPDGSPGQPSVNDWEENVQSLALQNGRWYPTALVLANGSILIVGGEGGSNGIPVPTLEVLPKPAGGPTVKFLDYLERTDPLNLYPFLVVLPSTNVFIGYYNEARVLDRRSFDTVKILPNIPAAVNNPGGGRTYPLEGAAMVLPQHAPYTAPLEIFICGGSTEGAGHALDNCVTIAPEAPTPTWIIERMPSKRVMPCMVALPDGTFMIMNGAQQGYAGFGLANEPNLNAIIYDPVLPLHQRFSILNNTSVARMYHSEATLLHDGRVLISGSDPNPDGPVMTYPQEFRIEAYIPPYLNQGRTQPTYTIAKTDWTYGGRFPIVVRLFHGITTGMRVSLIAASSSTHGNTMGSRTLFPAFTCAGRTCTVTAPPNAGVCPPGWYMLFVLDGPTPSVSQWVRIGGDPASLGNWPLGPDFTRPGL